MKQSKLRFIIGIAGIVVVVVIAAVVITSRGSSSAPSAKGSQDGMTVVNCLGGSEKTGLMNDPDVKRILQDKYHITVDFTALGSYAQVQRPVDQLKADKEDCLWPSSYSAQAIFESSSSTSFHDYQAVSVLQSPEVLYANKEVAEGLTRAGIVQKRDNTYFIVDVKKLLESLVLQSKTWADIGVDIPSGPILIGSSDPAKSNSGMTLAQLELAVLASGNPFQPATPEQAKIAIPKVKALIDSQGLMRPGSDSAFDQWLIQGTGGLLAGYENQLLQWVSTNNAGQVTDQITTLYPEPTIFNEHPILSLSSAGGLLIKAMQDNEVQDIAWKKYGFRSGTRLLEQAFPGVTVPPTTAIKKTQAPNQEVTNLLLNCFISGKC